MPLDRNAVMNVLSRLLKGGPLDHMPKRKGDLDVLLALAAARFVPDRIYAEPMVNEALLQWLDQFTAQAVFDHVTLRRYMVDLRFLVRDAAGRTYRANFAKVDQTITPDARSIDIAGIVVSLARARDSRRQEHARC
jgi:hypothetical protein